MKKSIRFEDPNERKEFPKVEEVIKEIKSNFLPVEGLPSNYRYYPEGSKLLARPLKVLEIKLLASMNEDNYDFIIDDILKRTTKGIPVEELFNFDKYFIIFWLRANTYKNSGYELDFFCNSEKCKKLSKYNFGLEILDIKYIDNDFDESLELEFPESKDKFQIKLKRIKDETLLNDFIKRSETSLLKYDNEILDIASNIKTINGEDLTLSKKYEYIETMNAEDFSYLISYIEFVEFGVNDKINAVCSNCKEVTPIGVTFRKEFFIPKRKF